MRYRYIRIGETIPRDALDHGKKVDEKSVGIVVEEFSWRARRYKAPIHWWQIWYYRRAI